MSSVGGSKTGATPSGGRLWLPFLPDCLWQTQAAPAQLSPASEVAVQDFAFATLESPHEGGWQRVGEWEAQETAAREEALQRHTTHGRTPTRKPPRMRR
jgi:hypothetical protein